MSSFPIFKINYVNQKNVISKILVFYGYHLDIADPSELFTKDPANPMFQDIFNPSEIQHIQKNNIEVEFVNKSIHIDDTIGAIKLKIVEVLNKNVSENEIYLYYLQKEELNPISAYQMLTLNDNLPLTRIRFDQLLLNLYNDDGTPKVYPGLQENPNPNENKEKYTFDDILKLDLPNNNDYLVSKPLGQRVIMGINEYPIIADPFRITQYDVLLERSRKELSTTNNGLLLDSGSIVNNNIYLCFAEDVFHYCDSLDLSTEYTSKIYFPFLYKNNINDVDELLSQRQLLISQTDALLTNSMKTFENIDMFYNVYTYQEPSEVFSLNQRSTGIKYMKVVMYPEYKVKIPIDVIFKLVHASKSSPLIKYNPASRQENIYRLYANNLTMDGRKIPYLSKTIILKLIKNIGKTKSVSAYVTVNYENTTYTIICEFEENGQISMYPLNEFEQVIKITNNDFTILNTIFSMAVNPLIEQITPFFEQSGYKFSTFHSIDANNIEIRDLKLQTVYNITKKIDMDKIKGCISSIFTMETNDWKKGVEMRYKRVSNFNKHNSQEAFIIEKQKQHLSNDEIAEKLVENYEGMTETQAYEIIDRLINELQVTRGANKKRAIEIKINPGFKTIFILQTITSELIITMDNINNLYYLYTIPIYLDSIVRITQQMNSTKYSIQNIEMLCSGKEIEDIEFEEIVAAPEEVLDENEIPIIEGENISYPQQIDYDNPEEIKKMNDLLDILGYSDESTDESIEGGALSTDSQSVESEVLSASNSSDQTISSAIPSEIGSISSIEGSIEGSEPEPEPESINIIPASQKMIQNVNITPDIKLSPKILEESESIPSEIIESEPEPEEILIKEVPEVELEVEEKSEPVEEESIEIAPNPVKITEASTKKIQQSKTQFENTVKNIEGLRLNNPYLFQDRLEKRDPNLFLTLREGKFDGYSRMCPSSVRRQPVILTKEELENISKKNKEALMGEFKEGNYTGPDVLQYGSDPDNQFYYMCPRYWCLQTNSVVTEQQINDGVCGGKDAIIPKGAKTVPKGKYIYQFYDNDTTHFPGFHKENTPNGLCIPCCYDSWNKPAQKNRREKCRAEIEEKKKKGVSRETEKELQGQFEAEAEEQGQTETVVESERKRELSTKKPIVKEVDEYIKGPEKYPLANNRWGYLPFAIQKFLQEFNVDCQISKMNTNIKPFHTCLLRHGIENSEKQSFIACIANALFYADKDDVTKKPKITKWIPDAGYTVPSIEIMKDLILKAINIDKFITYQNGDLVTSFANPDLEVNESLYHNSKLYEKIQNSPNEFKKEQMQFFKKVVQAFVSFQSFLKDKNILIDYTYLWDIICKPNPLLFETGINLIILEILNNDITNNVELICPTNHYSNVMYDSRKRTLIIVKQGPYFEPIYSYRDEQKRISVVKTFSELDPHLSKTMRNVFRKIIKPIFKDKCSPLTSRSEVYKFKRPPMLDDLIVELLKKKYQIDSQVLNFQGKVIGVLATNSKGRSGFIPCFPSSLIMLDKYDYVYMTDNIWKPYEETLKFLKEYYNYREREPENENENEKNKCIDGTDLCKVIEDRMIVGFLTKTNQFVQISEPIPESDVNDNIREVTNNNLLLADIETQTSEQVDSKRVDYIKRIELETAFYNVFRNTIRILINDYANSDKRKEIQEESNNSFVIYDAQLNKMIGLLKNLCAGYVVFVSKKNGFDYQLIKDIHTCVSVPKDKCNQENPICMTSNDKCSIILPKHNLLTRSDNEKIYYGRMADELIRYNRIKSFIFQPQSYLSFGQLKYNLKKDEMIILQTLLNQEFFENLIPTEINQYAKYNTYDSTEPIISQPYTNEVLLNEIIASTKEQELEQEEQEEGLNSGKLPLKSSKPKKLKPVLILEEEVESEEPKPEEPKSDIQIEKVSSQNDFPETFQIDIEPRKNKKTRRRQPLEVKVKTRKTKPKSTKPKSD